MTGMSFKTGGVAGLVGIESGVVSGLSNPNDSGVATPVETTPWEAITRSLSRYIRQLGRAPNFFTIGSTRLKWAFVIGCGALSRACSKLSLRRRCRGHATAARQRPRTELTVFRQASAAT